MATKTATKAPTPSVTKAATKKELAPPTVTAVSYGGNGFLVTETGDDGSVHQYHSPTDPTVENK